MAFSYPSRCLSQGYALNKYFLLIDVKEIIGKHRECERIHGGGEGDRSSRHLISQFHLEAKCQMI